MKEVQTNEFYDFAGFRLDVHERRLWRKDEVVSLTPKEFELLLALVERAPRVIEKDELLERIWKDTFVEEGTLTRNVSWLRKKLESGAQGNGAKFIETVPKRGYRFLSPVTQIKKTPALVVEEQTVQQIRIEETLSLPDALELLPIEASETAIASRHVSEIANRSFENSDFAHGHARISAALPAAKRKAQVLVVGLR